ncbi:hypothetical protein [Magnetospirillum sp. SS-4]|uniref:hypothetical protein n=1 Tax=Magnetospirillum sp. SS-4 TaxID=2681465 RepID=UPI001573F37F|nr:hypothetical protein [Magnetospirillum sp. SS-4]
MTGDVEAEARALVREYASSAVDVALRRRDMVPVGRERDRAMLVLTCVDWLWRSWRLPRSLDPTPTIFGIYGKALSPSPPTRWFCRFWRFGSCQPFDPWFQPATLFSELTMVEAVFFDVPQHPPPLKRLFLRGAELDVDDIPVADLATERR